MNAEMEFPMTTFGKMIHAIVSYFTKIYNIQTIVKLDCSNGVPYQKVDPTTTETAGNTKGVRKNISIYSQEANHFKLFF